MVADLAVMLGAITARAAVSQVIAGTPPSRAIWAQTSGDVANAVASAAPNSADRSLHAIARKLDRMPLERYAEHMAVGQRFMRYLPVEWRTDEDRKDLVREARSAFVHAAVVAEQLGDVRRLAHAELALAGCWLWVPSIPDVRQALRQLDLRLHSAVRTAIPSLELLALHQHTLELRARFDSQKDSGGIVQTTSLSDSRQSFAGITVIGKGLGTVGRAVVTVQNRRRETVRIRGTGTAALSSPQVSLAPRRRADVHFWSGTRDTRIGVEVEIRSPDGRGHTRITLWYGWPKAAAPAATPPNLPAVNDLLSRTDFLALIDGPATTATPPAKPPGPCSDAARPT